MVFDPLANDISFQCFVARVLPNVLSTCCSTYHRGKLAYQTNYCAGLRIINIEKIQDANPKLEEVGYFDVSPECATTKFHGSWSSYPFFASGTIVVQSIERGLFILEYTGPLEKERASHSKLWDDVEELTASCIIIIVFTIFYFVIIIYSNGIIYDYPLSGPLPIPIVWTSFLFLPLA